MIKQIDIFIVHPDVSEKLAFGYEQDEEICLHEYKEST